MMFVTVTAATALVSVALNVAAVGVAGYAGYRYLRGRYEEMKTWLDSHDAAQASPKSTDREDVK